jgi:DhnA family fructose-bisphosphate aldolase class Ia
MFEGEPSIDFDELRDLRASRPDAIVEAAHQRTRRGLSGCRDGVMIIAADHPARGMLGVTGRPDAMADRYDLLRRLVAALGRPGVDGVLGTADILEDLLLLGALEDKVVIGSMNRGGLQGATFELDDRFTGYDADTIAAMGFDAGKMLLRIGLDDPDTAGTLEASAHAVTQLARHRLVAMVEPFLSKRVGSKVVHDASATGVIRSVAIASGLGVTSAYTWLKVPVVADMERVMAATTLPTVLLGGDPSSRPDETYAAWAEALALPGVRGLVVGRTLLYPPDDAVVDAVDTAVSLVRAASKVPR